MPDDLPGPLFDWYDSGDVEVRSAQPQLTFQLTPQSGAYGTEWTARLGALVVGRRLFDITDGWGGRHPLDVPVVVVVIHHPPVDRPHAGPSREFAGDVPFAGTIASKCLALGLLDEVASTWSRSCWAPAAVHRLRPGAGRPRGADDDGPRRPGHAPALPGAR